MDYFPFCRCLTWAGCNEEKRTGARRLDCEAKEADFVNFSDNETMKIIDADFFTPSDFVAVFSQNKEEAWKEGHG